MEKSAAVDQHRRAGSGPGSGSTSVETLKPSLQAKVESSRQSSDSSYDVVSAAPSLAASTPLVSPDPAKANVKIAPEIEESDEEWE